MDHFVRTIRLISRLCGYFAAALIAVSVVIVCQMVFVRFVLNENTIWQTDFVTYSLVAATFIGSPYVLMTRGHVNVDVLPLYLGPRKPGAGADLDAVGHRFLRDHGGAHREYWLGVEPALALPHHVAGTAVDSLSRCR
jgi:TRAP-type mannitol/chloroaromatic compound transport system permease small subunit